MIGRPLIDCECRSADRASDLLEHHIRFLLRCQRSQAGLVLVHLINRKPRNALQVLVNISSRFITR